MFIDFYEARFRNIAAKNIGSVSTKISDPFPSFVLFWKRHLKIRNHLVHYVLRDYAATPPIPFETYFRPCNDAENLLIKTRKPVQELYAVNDCGSVRVNDAITTGNLGNVNCLKERNPNLKGVGVNPVVSVKYAVEVVRAEIQKIVVFGVLFCKRRFAASANPAHENELRSSLFHYSKSFMMQTLWRLVKYILFSV